MGGNCVIDKLFINEVALQIKSLGEGVKVGNDMVSYSSIC